MENGNVVCPMPIFKSCKNVQRILTPKDSTNIESYIIVYSIYNEYNIGYRYLYIIIIRRKFHKMGAL